jgi:hypothetical protein
MILKGIICSTKRASKDEPLALPVVGALHFLAGELFELRRFGTTKRSTPVVSLLQSHWPATVVNNSRDVLNSRLLCLK